MSPPPEQQVKWGDAPGKLGALRDTSDRYIIVDIMIDLAILGLLDEQDLHGYQLKKQLAELVGSRGMSFGSLYPALARLEKAGAVKAVEALGGEPSIPMTGALTGELAAFRARLGRPAHSRRTKKVYGITELGRQRLRDLLADPSTDDRTFTVQVAFCRALPPSERLALFERRKAELDRRLADRTRGMADRTNTYRRSLREHDARSLAHDLAWVDELIDATRAELDDEGDPASHLTGGSNP
jgi:DNA-binding PadR family transcriptional regulator